MSTETDRSAWSPDEADSLENIDKEVQLVSTSSESQSMTNHTKNNGSVNNVKVKLDCNQISEERAGQSNHSQPFKNFKLHSSCDDLLAEGNKSEFQNIGNQNVKNTSVNHLTASVNYKHKKTNIYKYDHVQSKIKHYFSNSNSTAKTEVASSKPKNTVISNMKGGGEKEEYLEQINKQLTKELDEKNAILSLLQENYEHLLFKYAEAQNRIDELRFKFLAETNDSKNSHFQNKNNLEVFSNFPCNDECLVKEPEIKCQKAVVAPIKKSDEHFHSPVCDAPISRPSSLPLDSNLKFVERDLIKATTPTDSEGLSSIITSMSGHSKILNSLDEENQINKKSHLLVYQTRNLTLGENSNVNDPFDKVKNWQNSLPPLEQIETPETTLYNVFSNNMEVYNSADTKYKEISSPKIEKDYAFLDESCPPSWREEQNVEYCRNDTQRSRSQESSKTSLRALSLPNTLSKQNTSQIYNKKSHHSLDVCVPSGQFQENCFWHNEDVQSPKKDIPSSCIIQRRQKRPQLLRCSSLPAYDCDSVKSRNCKNDIYIPPLDLRNVTLSDEESYCHQDYYLSKSNAVTSSSFATSRGGSVDRSIQTPQSFSSCKATISEENFFPRVPRSTVNKSTSITPDRSRAMDFIASKYDRSKVMRRKTPPSCMKVCSECCSDKSKNWCNVCGESISENRTREFFRNRSNSCESVHNNEIFSKESSASRSKPPFTRSVSFSSETNTPKYRTLEEDDVTGDAFFRPTQDSLDNFDVYASNLKARSQVVIKALTAHVNNS